MIYTFSSNSFNLHGYGVNTYHNESLDTRTDLEDKLHFFTEEADCLQVIIDWLTLYMNVCCLKLTSLWLNWIKFNLVKIGISLRQPHNVDQNYLPAYLLGNYLISIVSTMCLDVNKMTTNLCRSSLTLDMATFVLL